MCFSFLWYSCAYPLLEYVCMICLTDPVNRGLLSVPGSLGRWSPHLRNLKRNLHYVYCSTTGLTVVGLWVVGVCLVLGTWDMPDRIRHRVLSLCGWSDSFTRLWRPKYAPLFGALSSKAPESLAQNPFDQCSGGWFPHCASRTGSRIVDTFSYAIQFVFLNITTHENTLFYWEKNNVIFGHIIFQWILSLKKVRLF